MLQARTLAWRVFKLHLLNYFETLTTINKWDKKLDYYRDAHHRAWI